MTSPFFERVAEAAARRESAADRLRRRYAEARDGEPDHPQTDLQCVVDRCGAMVAPGDALDSEQLGDGSVTTVEGSEWAYSDVVVDMEECR